MGMRRRRQIPQEFDDEEERGWGQYSEEQLARRFDSATKNDREIIFNIFRKRTRKSMGEEE